MVTNKEGNVRWYRNTSTLISWLALFVAAFTLGMNEYRNYWTGRAATKARLIEQMDRFYSEAERAHLRQMKESDPAASFAINGVWESRKEVIINDLAWMARRIPNDIEPSEYLALSGIFVNNARFADAIYFAREGSERARSQRERIAAKQRLGRVLYPRSEGQDLARARELLRDAANWYSKSSEVRDVLQAGFVYSRWAELEVQYGTLDEAARLTRSAIQQNLRLPHVKTAAQQVALLRGHLERLESGQRPKR